VATKARAREVSTKGREARRGARQETSFDAEGAFAELCAALGEADARAGGAWLEGVDPAAARAGLARAVVAMTFALAARARGGARSSRLGDRQSFLGNRREALLAAHPFLAALDEAPQQVARASARLEAAGDVDEARVGDAYEALVGLELRVERDGARARLSVERGVARRRTGSHYTPRAIASVVVARALAPLLERAGSAEALLALRVCDPAMGAGALLVEVCRQLAEALARARGEAPSAGHARAVAEACLAGVDRDPVAIDAATLRLRLVCDAEDAPEGWLAGRLRAGDALVGRLRGRAPEPPPGVAPFDWDEAFPDALARPNGGFDACLGNPPWIAYAGRAAQPIARALFDYYLAAYAAFFGYRTVHGLFVERCAELLREGGRLGLVVPTSVSDLDGYAPARRAHDALCDVDPELPDFGARAFDGVFQPAMALLSTRRERRAIEPGGKRPAWPLLRDDLDPVAAALLARLEGAPTLPASLFGERGFQTVGADVARLRVARGPEGPFTVPIREGADVRSFVALPPRLYLDPASIEGRLRSPDDFRAVALLLRQTARFPVAALSDGLAFRNSILAGFEGEGYTAHALLAYLNAAPVRFLHYARFRDARQGMPQVKIGHLRATPAPLVERCSVLAELEDAGRAIAAARQATSDDVARVDELAALALGLDERERAVIAAFRASHRAP
jgi:hypothetical protein